MRRRLLIAALPPLLAAALPGWASADPGKNESGKGRKGNGGRGDDKKGRAEERDEEERDEEERRSPPPTPVPSLVAPQGTEVMVSQPVRLAGAQDTGAGPLRLDVEGASPNSAYEVAYVPAAAPAAAVMLGTVRTDAAGAFKGAAPQPLPAIALSGREGVVVLRRLQV